MEHTKYPITVLSKTLELAECPDGWWLWDDTRKMNLSVRAKSLQEALVEALTYYQRRLSEVEAENKRARSLLDNITEQLQKFQDED